jgi:hypothetical protein
MIAVSGRVVPGRGFGLGRGALRRARRRLSEDANGRGGEPISGLVEMAAEDRWRQFPVRRNGGSVGRRALRVTCGYKMLQKWAGLIGVGVG